MKNCINDKEKNVKKNLKNSSSKFTKNKFKRQIFLNIIKLLKLIWLIFLNFHKFFYQNVSLFIAEKIFLNPMLIIIKTLINIFLIPIHIAKFLSKFFLILLILKMLNFTLSKKHSRSEDNLTNLIAGKENFFSNLHQEYSSFLKKYEKNSCIMQVFNSAKLNCNSEKTDEINPIYAYKMTECFFNTINKKIPVCNYSKSFKLSKEPNHQFDSKINNCISKLEGDAWTTFTNFLNHIDNLCFFHRTLIWEKSSDFIYSKMLNSSIGILTELSQGSNLAKRILMEQEKFSSQLKDNMTDTLEEFKKIQTYFESFEKLEAKIKNDMIYIEQKINKNNKQLIDSLKNLSNNFQYLDGFFFNKNGSFVLKFYVFLIVYAWIFSFNSNVNKYKFKIFLVILMFLCLEKFLFNANKELKNFYKNKNLINLDNNHEEIKLTFNNHDKQNNSTFSNKDKIKEKFQLFESLKISFVNLLNSTIIFDEYLNKDDFYFFNQFESYMNTLYLYLYRLVCFLILNIICWLIKSNSNLKENDKSYLEKIMYSNNTNSYFSNLSNSKGNITPLWMKKYFSRIQSHNEVLLEKFKLLKTKLNKGNNSLTATPSFKG